MNSDNKKTWIPAIRRRGESVLMTSYLMTAYQDQYHQEVLGLSRGIYDTKYLDGIVFVEANDVGQFTQTLAEHLSTEYLQYFIARCRFECDRLLVTGEGIRSKTSGHSLTNSERMLYFSTYSSDVIRVMPFLFGIVTLEGVLQKDLEEKLESHCKSQNLDVDPKHFLSSLIYPEEKNIPSRALTDMYELAAEVQSSNELRKLFALGSVRALQLLEDKFPEFFRKLQSYLNHYDFMNMEYYVGYPMDMSDLFERLSEVVDNANDRLVGIKKDSEETAKRSANAGKKLNLTPELHAYLDTIKTVHYLRQYRADILFKAGREVFDFMTGIGETLNLTYSELISMTWQEISDSLIRGQLSVDKELILSRMSGYGILLVDGKLKFITGSELDEELVRMPIAKKAEKEFSGDVAFPGIYRGPVAIVSSVEEIDKVKSGDVLVSPMTDPYYVPAMIRAGAIVTDEGGILSHAAIVSRELGVPCIVGTGVATSTLEDGMTVEVDATGDNGTVRIVER